MKTGDTVYIVDYNQEIPEDILWKGTIVAVDSSSGIDQCAIEYDDRYRQRTGVIWCSSKNKMYATKEEAVNYLKWKVDVILDAINDIS